MDPEGRDRIPEYRKIGVSVQGWLRKWGAGARGDAGTFTAVSEDASPAQPGHAETFQSDSF